MFVLRETLFTWTLPGMGANVEQNEHFVRTEPLSSTYSTHTLARSWNGLSFKERRGRGGAVAKAGGECGEPALCGALYAAPSLDGGQIEEWQHWVCGRTAERAEPSRGERAEAT